MTFLQRLSVKPVVDTKPCHNISIADNRVEFDLDHLGGITSAVSPFESGNNRKFRVIVKPKDPSVYEGGEFHFKIVITDEYPMEPPKVTYVGPRRIFHPNIAGDEKSDGDAKEQVVLAEWKVCLRLHKDWKPVLGLRDVIMGLEVMFHEPQMEDALNGVSREAAQLMLDDPRAFERKVKAWMHGNYI